MKGFTLESIALPLCPCLSILVKSDGGAVCSPLYTMFIASSVRKEWM